MEPAVSVIIPTYNRAHVLGRAIKSVVCQTFANWEVIIVDDGSTDDTEVLLQSFMTDARIVRTRHLQNRGQNAALNTALRLARGRYLAFLDSDDEWLPTMLEKQIASIEVSDGVSCSYTWAGSLRKGTLVPAYRFCLEGWVYRGALEQGYLSHMITLMIRRECLEKAGNFDESFVVCQDDDFCFRLAKHYKFALVKEILAIIHDDAGVRTISNRLAYANGWWKLIRKFETEIRNTCGSEILARHFAKAASLFMAANAPREARAAAGLAFREHPSAGTSCLLAATCLPCGAFRLVHKVFRKVQLLKKVMFHTECSVSWRNTTGQEKLWSSNG